MIRLDPNQDPASRSVALAAKIAELAFRLPTLQGDSAQIESAMLEAYLEDYAQFCPGARNRDDILGAALDVDRSRRVQYENAGAPN